MEHSGYMYIYIYAVYNIYEGSGVDQFKYAKKTCHEKHIFLVENQIIIQLCQKNMLMK